MNFNRRRGFTLPEVLVTIAIVATLAAVLLPALNSQLSKGESARAASDLLAIQTAISTFVSDVRRYPGDLEDLVTQPDGTDNDITPATYPVVLRAKWRGPYLGKELASGNMITGFGANISGAFTKSLTTEYNGVAYVRVNVTPITLDDFNKIDLIIDETSGSSTGQIQFDATGSGTARFYAIPIQ